MMEGWGDALDFNAWVQSVNARMDALTEEVASLLTEVAALQAQLETQSFMSPGMIAIVQPRNRSRNV